MRAMVMKEFRQLRRDHRTLAMMIVMPLVLLIVFGYAASFDVAEVPTAVLGPGADDAAERLPSLFSVVEEDRAGDEADGEALLREGRATVAVVAEPARAVVLVDGSQLFQARAAMEALARLQAQIGAAPGGSPVPRPEVKVLFNPDLETSAVMVPALAGLILLFVGTVITSVGVVRERQAGTLEQLAVMPLRPRDVFIGKVAPYFLVAAVDLTVILAAGTLIFDVPFNGSVPVLALGAVLFLFVTLGLGVLISSVSENQGQAIQLAMMALLPQVLLSGLIFPVESMAAGVRWISYLLPLTYFTRISRGVILRDAPLSSLGEPMVLLGVLGVAVFSLAVLRFRRDLAPSVRTADQALEGAVR